MYQVTYGSHSFSLATGRSFHRKRKAAERVRRWWSDAVVPGREPNDHWAQIRKVDKHGCLAS